MQSTMTTNKFLKIVVSPQAYLNLLYLLAAFPLGVFYFVFLVSGLSLGISLVIVWIGLPILVLVGAIWWLMARFEYSMANQVLKEDLYSISIPPNENLDLVARFKLYFTNPFTWKSLLYLFIKFPLGIATFTILATLVSLTIMLIGMPVITQVLGDLNTSISLGPALPEWQVDSLADAMLCTLIGVLIWPVTLHVINGMTWLHAKLARLLLNSEPLGFLPENL